jgi:hypothetical protein
MRRHGLDAIVFFTLATIACAYVSLAVPGERTIALHVYLLFVGALLMLLVVSAFGAAVPGRRRSELTRALEDLRRSTPRVSELAKMEREVTLSIGSAYDLHARLLPQLRDIAAARLERVGRQPGPDTLGAWWPLLRPDREEPRDRFAPGIAEGELRALVADLERIG